MEQHNQHKITIGTTDLRVAPLGVGTWAWGDRTIWGYGKQYRLPELAAAFWASINAGITLFDTAEVYGNGASERILGRLMHTTDTPVVVASKYMPWRLSARSLRRALDNSRARLNAPAIDLYQIHAYNPIISTRSLMDALADAVAEGKIRAVGVSNYNTEQMLRAHEALARRGIALASNQVEYSLIARAPERNGLLSACHALGVTLIAYSPLAMGLLTGKYIPGVQPAGPRRFSRRFSSQNLARIQPLIGLLREVGTAHGGKTPSQVALNWLIQMGALPIPGAKNLRQAQENAGALGWALAPDEVRALDDAAYELDRR